MASHQRSYRETPIRMAEFYVLRRIEAMGALSGLAQVRQFAITHPCDRATVGKTYPEDVPPE
jgi:threonyl-tRNA synthetase